MGTVIFEDLVKENKAAFIAGTKEIAAKLGVPYNWLMGLFYIECTLNHRAKNRWTQAVGLIQFLPKTAVGLGTTAEALLAMSNVEQLEYVLKYLMQYKSKIKAFVDLYFAVFRPADVGKYADFVLGSVGGNPAKLAQQNPGFDLDKNNELTKGEVQQAIMSAIPSEYHTYLV